MTRPTLDLIEQHRTCDKLVVFPDGSWATFRVRPPGDGWTVLQDRERATVWTRRQPVRWRPVRLRSGGWVP